MNLVELFGTGAAGHGDHDVVLHYVAADATAHVVPLSEAGTVPFETALLVRPIPNHKGQRHTVGWYWSATTGHHVEFESHLESCWLTIFDFDPTITAMAAQPFRITGRAGDVVLDHIPDFFLRRDGSGVVVDVRHDDLVDERFASQCAATASCCQIAGLDHEVFGLPDPQWWANVRFLAGYRRPPALGLDYAERMVELARQPVPVRELIGFVDAPAIARPLLAYLCWQQRLTFDMTRPLADSTLVVASKDQI